MRLYPLSTGTVRVKDPEYGTFDIKDHGGFDFPDDLSDRLGNVCVRGQRQWESEQERTLRLHATETERQRDPAVLYGAVAELVKLAQAVRGDDAATAGATPAAKSRARKTSAAPAADSTDSTATQQGDDA